MKIKKYLLYGSIVAMLAGFSSCTNNPETGEDNMFGEGTETEQMQPEEQATQEKEIVAEAEKAIDEFEQKLEQLQNQAQDISPEQQQLIDSLQVKKDTIESKLNQLQAQGQTQDQVDDEFGASLERDIEDAVNELENDMDQLFNEEEI